MYAKTARDRVIWRTHWWIPAKLWSCMYLAEPMNWLDFGVTRLKVKGHRAHYVCKNSLWSRYLKNRLMDSCQTLVMYVSCRADELIRFWGHEVKGHRAHYVCKNSLWSRYLKNRLMDSCQLRSCMLLAKPMNWLDFGVMRSRSKVMRLIMYAKIAFDRIIIRTDWWIPAKLRSCMYLAEPMNWVDSWVMRSKVKGHGLIMYAKIACERILIRTDRWITILLKTSCRANELSRC